MRNIFEYLGQKIRAKRLNVFVLFLLLAFFISLLSKLTSSTTQTLQFELQPTKLPSRILLVEDRLPIVDVTITTNGFSLLKYAFKKLKLNVDFSTLQKNETVYYWEQSAYRAEIAQFFNSSTIIENIHPTALTFDYATQFAKKVPVTINLQPEFVVGYDLKTPLRAQPDSITIVGPEQYLKAIDAVATEGLKMNAVKTDIDVALDLDIYDFPQYLKFSTTQVQVVGAVDKFTEGAVSVPVQLVNIPDGILVSIFPKEIPVVYYTSLSTYDAITPEDFRIECDFSTLDYASGVMVPKLVLYPSEAKTAALQINSIEYIITEKND
jgi:hypothetical protein